MRTLGYGRLRDIGGLPDLVKNLAGEEGLHRVFADQDLPIELLRAPDRAVPMRDIIGLYHCAAQVTGLRSFALDATANIDVAEHGLTGDYVMQAPDLRGALRRFQRALPYHESGSRLEVEADDRELRIFYRSAYQDMIGWNYGGDFTLCIIADVITGYVGSDWRPLRIETCYGRGRWERDHEDFFGVPVLPGLDRVGIVIDRDWLGARPFGSSDRNGGLVTMADLVRMGSELPRDFPSIVTNVIDRRLREGRTDIGGAARTLGVSRRTLQRRLGEESVQYNDLLLAHRMRRARELLEDSDVPIQEIARAVGYAQTPQFSRAFKPHVGTTPQRYRETLN